MLFFTAGQLADLMGATAAVLTTASFVPQAWQTWKSGRADGVSLGMYCILTAGTAMWAAYGVVIGAWPVIIANGITFVLALFILWMKLRFRHASGSSAGPP